MTHDSPDTITDATPIEPPTALGLACFGPNLIDHTVTIVAAFASNAVVRADDLPGLIVAVHSALSTISDRVEIDELEEAPPVPAVPIKKSVFPDGIVCLEDGVKLKSLKRHLSAKYGLTPAAYRERWGLPDDYPMTCADYSAVRSKLARDAGLGQRNSTVEA